LKPNWKTKILKLVVVRSFCFGLILSPPLAWIAKNGYLEWNISPFNYFLPFGKQNMSEDYTKYGENCGIPARKDNTKDVEWKWCLCRILHFPFNLRLNTWDAHGNILVLALAQGDRNYANVPKERDMIKRIWQLSLNNSI
jgi:hypothetical protein